MNDPLKGFRRSVRAWRNRRRLLAETAHYRARFLRSGLEVPDDRAVSQAFRSRYPDLTPVPKGAFHIVAVYHNYNWEDESLRPALEKFGRVFHHDWARGSGPGRGLVDFVRARAREAPVHLVFAYLSGESVSPESARELSALGIPTVNLALNDKEAFVGKVRNGAARGARDICRHFDLCWTSTRDALEKYCVEGALPIYLPEGANPDIHRPYDLEKTFDVTFVGQRYGNRPAVVGALASAGIRVEAFGPGWPAGPLSTEEMVRMYSRSRINLGFGGVAGHKDTYCLKGRDFEIPMSGGLYLTEQHEELEGCYEIGREIVTYSGLDDLVSKVRRLLSRPDEAERIRTEGRRRALREHSWEMRFEKIFGLMGLLRKNGAGGAA